MAWTLAEANLLTTDMFLQGVIETILNVGKELVDRLPFEDAVGTQFTYVRESTLPTAQWYNVNEEIAESTGTHAQVSITLKELIADSYLDNFEKRTKSNINSLEAETVRAAVKGAWEKFLTDFFYGTKDPIITKAMSGLWALLPSAQTIKSNGASATGAALSLSKLDQLIDSIKPGKPDLLIMNRTIRRRLSQALRSSTTGVGVNIVTTTDEFGRFIETYAGIPIFFTDYITQTELMDSSGDFSASTGGATSAIWAVKFGAAKEGGLFGINGSPPFELDIHPREKHDGDRYRIKWYVNMGLGRNQSLAALTNITDAAVTA